MYIFLYFKYSLWLGIQNRYNLHQKLSMYLVTRYMKQMYLKYCPGTDQVWSLLVYFPNAVVQTTNNYNTLDNNLLMYSMEIYYDLWWENLSPRSPPAWTQLTTIVINVIATRLNSHRVRNINRWPSNVAVWNICKNFISQPIYKGKQ